MPSDVVDVFEFAFRKRMLGELKTTEIEKGTVNVYEDLCLSNATEIKVKATLAAKIGEIIKQRHLTQIRAAEILGMPNPNSRACCAVSFGSSARPTCWNV